MIGKILNNIHKSKCYSNACTNTGPCEEPRGHRSCSDESR